VTDLPYTDDDLRVEAAICLLALSTAPAVPDILRWLTGAYVESLRNADRSGQTWDDILDSAGLADVARKVHDLAIAAADVSRWAVQLGADGLEPDERQFEVKAGDKVIARVHFAFDPDMADDMRTALVTGLSDALAAHL
jgi:hypothetical protein